MKSAIDRPSRARFTAVLGLVLALPACISGCNVVAPIAMIAAGPGEVKAVYNLDPTRKTVIFVDDPANKIAQRRIRTQIGVTAQDQLLKRKLIREGNMVDSRSAIAAASQSGSEGLLSVTEVGQAVDAEVVIYVLVTRFDMTTDGINFVPSSEVEIKIFDAQTHSRIWPPDGTAGYRSQFSNPTGNRTPPSSRTGALRAQSDLAELTGLGLAQLFYDVERPQSLRR